MKKQLTLIIAFGIFTLFTLFLIFKKALFKEKAPIAKYSRLNAQKKLENGEWISNLDSLSGISIRENKLAFFKNMEFKSDDIYEYEIIDSIYKNKNSENRIGEFLMLNGFSDTIYYQIVKKNDTSLTLIINKNKTEIFNLKPNYSK